MLLGGHAPARSVNTLVMVLLSSPAGLLLGKGKLLRKLIRIEGAEILRARAHTPAPSLHFISHAWGWGCAETIPSHGLRRAYVSRSVTPFCPGLIYFHQGVQLVYGWDDGLPRGWNVAVTHRF